MPQRLVELVGLRGEVVVAGADDRIEIWPPRRWEEIESAGKIFFEQLAKAYFRQPPQGEEGDASEREQADRRSPAPRREPSPEGFSSP